jgi:hypothetical protein
LIKASSDGIALTEQLRQTQRPLFLFTGLWVVSTALLTFGPKYWSYQFGLTVFAIVLNLVAGATMLIAYLRHIKTMDELQRQTHLEAMSLTLGITMIITVVYGALPKSRNFIECSSDKYPGIHVCHVSLYGSHPVG